MNNNECAEIFINAIKTIAVSLQTLTILKAIYQTILING